MRVLAAVGLFTIVASVGCGSKSSSSGQNGAGAPPVTAGDLAPTNGFTLNTLDQNKIVSKLEAEGTLYNNQPAATSPGPCDPLLEGVTIQASQAQFTVDQTIDVTTCMTQIFATGGNTVNLTTATAHVYVVGTCTSGDFSSLNGKTIKDLTNPTVDAICKGGTGITQTLTTLVGTITVSGEAIQFNSTSWSHNGSAAAGPCPFSSSGTSSTTDPSCIFVSKADTTETGNDTTQKTEDFEKFTASALTDDVSSASNVWHSGGTMNVIYDNWTGTVTFTGSAAAPTYSLTPAGGAAITGTLTAQPQS